MARARTLPRFMGKLLLHDSNLLAELDIPPDVTNKQAQMVLDNVNELVVTAQQSFELDTGRPVLVYDSGGGGYAWCVEDTAQNSAQYRWLSRKVKTLEKKIAQRMNKDGIKDALHSEDNSGEES